MKKLFFIFLFILSGQLFAGSIENLESGDLFNIISEENSYHVSGNGEEFTLSKAKLENTIKSARKSLESGAIKVPRDQFMLYTNIVIVEPILYESFMNDNNTGVSKDQFKIVNDVLNAIK